MGLASRRTRIYGLCFLGLPGAVWTFSTLPRQPTPSLRRLRMSSASTSGDVLVIGGGLAGLSTALELSLRGAKVMVLNRDSKESASMAAGGMLAPQAERLGPSAYLDLCLQSRSMYADWVTELEKIAGPSFSTGFSASGGFLAPAFEGDAVFQWEPPAEAGPSYWLDRTQIRGMEPHLSQELAGGWWYPEDMQVDARLLYKTLREACVRSQVTILEGADVTADAVVFHPVHAAVKSVRLKDGRKLEFSKVVVANGAWMNELLPIPVSACKGQMMSLRPQAGSPPPLSRVLFGDGCYIIPKADGRIVVGATVEDGVMDQRVTAAGLAELTSKALKICPALGGLEVEESWAGLRPTTPDFLPVLGTTPWSNLYVAGGYWRNGVLLAPRTGQLLADVVEGRVSDDDSTLLQHFSWARFLQNNRKGSSPVRASPRKAVSVASAPAPIPAPVAVAPTPVAPTPVSTPVSSHVVQETSGTGDPYEAYKQGKQSSDEEEERSKAILREARRKNREDAIQVGLETDELGLDVGARFAVPSSPLSKEWSVMDEAAERGQAAIAALPWMNELGRQYQGKSVNQDAPVDADAPSMTIREFAEMLGYDLDKVKEAPAGAKPKRGEPDTYDDDYNTEVRPPIGWEVAKKRREEAQKGGAQATQGGKEKQASGHTDDPYQDLVKLREQEKSAQVLREARRVNREGMVTFYDDAASLTGSSSQRYSTVAASEFDRFDQMANSGLASGRVLPLDPEGVKHAPISSPVSPPVSSPISSPISSPASATAIGGKSKAEALAEYMAGLADEGQGTQRNTAFTPPNPRTMVSSPTAPARKVAPAPKVEAPAASEARRDRPLPPWAAEIEALYEKVRLNQQEERRRRGLPATGKEDIIIPFKQTFTEEQSKAMTDEEVLASMELLRVNPDGTLTRVMPGQGMPPPWKPNNPGQIEEIDYGVEFGEEGHLGRNSTSARAWALK